ncbi:MAG: glycosyltransferase family 39 protein [Anaerolineae bacterium]|nr:glycosyltransferase family 39 protein [Anaerolineae bacterium]
MKPAPLALRGHPWLLALPLLLLAMFFATSQLDNRAFQEDELATLRLAGSGQRQPLPFADFQAMLVERSAEQAFGWPLLVSLWVRIAGWSEPAVRILPLLAGMLALAWTWRLGRDLSHHSLGLLALLMLATSAFFIGFMWYARAFTMLALCSTLLLWCYWRICFHDRAARPVHFAGLLLAATALAYLHYFSVTVIAAVALFHLISGRDHRHFRWPLAMFAIAALLATMQLPTFFTGLEESLVDENLKLDVLGAAAVLTTFLRFLVNRTLEIPLAAGWLLLATLIGTLVWWFRRKHETGSIPLRFLTMVYAMAFLLVLIANEFAQVITPGRIRYLMPLWPLTAILLAWFVRKQRTWRFRVAEWVLVAMIVTGLHAINHPFLKYSFGNSAYRDRMHVIQREIVSAGREGDVLLAGEFDKDLTWSLVLEFYLQALPLPVTYVDAGGAESWLASARAHSRFWLLQTSHDSEVYVALASSLVKDAYVCESRDLRAVATLELYAWSDDDC